MRGRTAAAVTSLIHQDAPEVGRQIHPLLVPDRHVQAEPVDEQDRGIGGTGRAHRDLGAVEGLDETEILGRQIPQIGVQVVLVCGGASRCGSPRPPATAPAAIPAPIGGPPATHPTTSWARAHRSASRSRRRSCPHDAPSSCADDGVIALRSQEHDRIARRRRQVTAVDHQLVHRHAPRHPAASSPDQDVGSRGQRPRVPVRVAHRHGGDPRVALQVVPVPVAMSARPQADASPS